MAMTAPRSCSASGRTATAGAGGRADASADASGGPSHGSASAWASCILGSASGADPNAGPAYFQGGAPSCGFWPMATNDWVTK